MNMSYATTVQTPFKITKTVLRIPYATTVQNPYSLCYHSTKHTTHYAITVQNHLLTTLPQYKTYNSLRYHSTKRGVFTLLPTLPRYKTLDFSKSTIIFLLKNLFKSSNKKLFCFVYLNATFIK